MASCKSLVAATLPARARCSTTGGTWPCKVLPPGRAACKGHAMPASASNPRPTLKNILLIKPRLKKFASREFVGRIILSRLVGARDNLSKLRQIIGSRVGKGQGNVFDDVPAAGVRHDERV